MTTQKFLQYVDTPCISEINVSANVHDRVLILVFKSKQLEIRNSKMIERAAFRHRPTKEAKETHHDHCEEDIRQH